MFNLSVDVINLNTGLTIPYFEQEAPIMPISVYGIYVQGFSSLKQRYFPGALDFYGYDWKLNAEQYIVRTDLSPNDTYYTYIDESGNQIYLTKKETINGVTHYSNDSGLAYNTSNRWLGKKGNRQMYHFDSLGRLDKMQNADGQYILITYNG